MILIFLFLFISISQATVWQVHEAVGAPGQLSSQLAHEWRQIAISGQKGYFSIQNAVFVSPRQYSMDHPDGNLYGYPFYQKFGFAGASVGEKGQPYWGMNYFYARKGWQTEDFFLFSDEGPYNSYTSSHMIGLYYSSYLANSWVIGSGYLVEEQSRVPRPYKAQGAEHDAYVLFRYAGISALAVGSTELDWAEVSYNAESWVWSDRQAFSLLTYLPRFTYTWTENSQRLLYEQNLWGQNVYQRSWMDLENGDWLGTSLDYYPDYSRFFAFGFCLFENADRILWGWNVRLGLVEFGYSWIDDIVEGRAYRGSWRFGFHMSIGSMLNNSFRGRGSNRPEAQTETKQ